MSSWKPKPFLRFIHLAGLSVAWAEDGFEYPRAFPSLQDGTQAL